MRVSETRGSPDDVDKEGSIKWWDALDTCIGRKGAIRANDRDTNKGLQLARECRHPDAQWLASLFPVGTVVSEASFRQTMLDLPEDPRAMHLAGGVAGAAGRELLLRAANLGYAPAQARLADLDCNDEASSFLWAQRAAEQGDRCGLYRLGQCYYHGLGCAKDQPKAIGLYEQAAHLGSGEAQFLFGKLAFHTLRWERYYWQARAASRGVQELAFLDLIDFFLPSFERGDNVRILHAGAPLIRRNFDVTNGTVFGRRLARNGLERAERIVELYETTVLRPALEAIDCWSAVGRRCGVVKDIRVKIAKMAWEEAWRWGEKAEVERRNRMTAL
jgi:hypothetical protein